MDIEGIVNYESVCACGEYKSRRRVHCQKCALSKQRKRQGILTNEDYCPCCGGRKDRRATVCRHCVTREQRVEAGKKGGAKTAEARRKTDERRGLVCPRCGGRKSPRGSICSACWMVHTKRVQSQQIERKIRYAQVQSQ